MTEVLVLYRKQIVTWATLLGLAALLGFMVAAPGWQIIAVAGVFLLILFDVSQLRLVGLVAVFLIAENLVHLLKRAVFVFGPQPRVFYYGIQLLPTVFLGIILIVTMQRLDWGMIPTSGRILLGYLVVALLTTLLSPSGLPWIVRLTAIQQQLFPFLIFFVGITLSLEDFATIGKTMALLAVISVVYALIQFIGGPTVIDRAWAMETHAYSIQGRKVFGYLKGSLPEFRAFSYYADPLTWGLLLVACFVGGTVSKEMGALSPFKWWSVVIIILTGLFISLTRTPWVGLLGTLFIYVILSQRRFQHSWLIFGLALAGFVGVVWGGTYVFGRFFVTRKWLLYDNPILARYATLGTASARIWAWDILKGVLPTNWLIGKGYGFSSYYVGRLSGVELGELGVSVYSHNFIVELVLYTGLPGLLIFLSFYLQWLREGLSALYHTEKKNLRRAVRWIIAFSFGYFLTGYFSGSNFMNYQFFLLLGVVSGCFARLNKIQETSQDALQTSCLSNRTHLCNTSG